MDRLYVKSGRAVPCGYGGSVFKAMPCTELRQMRSMQDRTWAAAEYAGRYSVHGHEFGFEHFRHA